MSSILFSFNIEQQFYRYEIESQQLSVSDIILIYTNEKKYNTIKRQKHQANENIL